MQFLEKLWQMWENIISSDCNWTQTILDIQATIECGFTLERVRDMTRTYRPNIKFVATEKRSNYLVSEANYHTTKSFPENIDCKFEV